MNELIYAFYLIPIGLIFLLSQIIITYRNNNYRKTIQHNIRVEKTRKYFAELRNRLFELELAGKIDSKSATFSFHYSLFTVIMRRPDQYKKISNILYLTLLKDTETKQSNEIFIHKLKIEKNEWSDEIKQLVHDTAHGLAFIIFDYSSIMRLLNTLIKFVGSSLLKKINERVEIFEAKKDPFVRNIRNSSNTLISMST